MAVHEQTWPAVPSSVSRARTAVAAWAAQEGLPDSLVHNLKVAVSEASTNAVVHAYEGMQPADFTVAAVFADGSVELVVRDRGRGMVPRADAPHMGLGLPLMANLADSLEFTLPEEGGTQLRLLFSVKP